MINEMTLDEKFNELGIKPKNLSLGTQRLNALYVKEQAGHITQKTGLLPSH